MPTYSNSKLSTYENCPQLFKLRCIDKIELPDAGEGIEEFLGSRVHETVEKLHKELILEKLILPSLRSGRMRGNVQLQTITADINLSANQGHWELNNSLPSI